MTLKELSQRIARTARETGRMLRHSVGGVLQMYGPTRVIYNLNYCPGRQQQRVALVYLSRIHDRFGQTEDAFHPSTEQHLLMLNVLLELGFVVDIYNCSGDTPYNFPKEATYDIILGFGPLYIRLCEMNPQARKILFTTENAPWVVRDKFAERMSYYRASHSAEVYTVTRDDFYTDRMFNVSDMAIAMTGSYNISGIKSALKDVEQIPVNALAVHPCELGTKDFAQARRRFVWFGSRGLIHKGLDILVDVFRELPDYELSIYGAPRSELRGWSLPPNVRDMGRINVQESRYIEEVVQKHAFVVSLSCSEGQASGVATCMLSGLIPIVTPETGYDDCPHVLPFDDWHREAVADTIRRAASLSVEELQQMEKAVAAYARDHYTNEAFRTRFRDIVIKYRSK